MSDFDHLRDLPDGTLTKAEVGILLNEVDKAEFARIRARQRREEAKWLT